MQILASTGRAGQSDTVQLEQQHGPVGGSAGLGGTVQPQHSLLSSRCQRGPAGRAGLAGRASQTDSDCVLDSATVPMPLWHPPGRQHWPLGALPVRGADSAGGCAIVAIEQQAGRLVKRCGRIA